MKSNSQRPGLPVYDVRYPVRYPSNPFATRFVCPGQLDWVSSPNHSVAALAKRFATEHGNHAAIVGPHGSGKTTLLTHLLPLLGEVLWHQAVDHPGGVVHPAGTTVWLGLRRLSHRPFQQIIATKKYWRQGGLLVLDGLEQLRPWETVCVRVMQRSARMGLLATCHRPHQCLGWRLSTLINTTAEAQTVQRLVVDRLKSVAGISTLVTEELAELPLIDHLLSEAQGSVREVFMRMYDVVENSREPSGLSGSHRSFVSKITCTAGR